MDKWESGMLGQTRSQTHPIKSPSPSKDTSIPHLVTNGFEGRSTQNQRIASLQQYALFNGIIATDCASIIATAQEKTFLRRQTIFFEGDCIRQIWLLLSGSAKVAQFGPNGYEVILRLGGPGEVLGPLGLSSAEHYCATAKTLEPASVLVWDVPAFQAVSDRFPLLLRNAARILSGRLVEMEQRFRELATQKVATRLSIQLVRLVGQVGRQVGAAMEINLSQEELAQLTGTTLFTVSRLLSTWEQKGFVQTRREAVTILNAKGLAQLSELG